MQRFTKVTHFVTRLQKTSDVKLKSAEIYGREGKRKSLLKESHEPRRKHSKHLAGGDPVKKV